MRRIPEFYELVNSNEESSLEETELEHVEAIDEHIVSNIAALFEIWEEPVEADILPLFDRIV